VTSPLATGGTLTLRQGDDYKNTDGRALSFAFTSVPNLTGATVTLSIVSLYDSSVSPASSTALSVTSPTSNPTVVFELTRTQTATLNVGGNLYKYQVVAVLSNSDVVTLAEGSVVVQQ
jgi:hypothetical protein